MNGFERMTHKFAGFVLLAMALCPLGARADDPAPPMFSFSGFGTAGLAHSSENQADFTSSAFKPNGTGHTHDWSADVDSLIGGQVTANLSPKLSAVLQVISEQNYDNTYRPHVEWANIKYQFTPEFSVRLGRTVLPTFLYSDTRKVAYTYPWVRPPIEMYRLLPVTNQDGVDVSYHLRFGEWTHVVQANMGRKDTHQPDGSLSKAQRSWSLIYTATYGPLTLHASYSESHLTLTGLNPLFNAFRGFGAEGNAIADRYDPFDKLDRLVGLGASYDPGGWFVMGEWGAFNAHSILVDSSAWYLSGGFRIGNFTPYLTYARSKADGKTSDPGLNLATVPPSQVGTATELNAILNAILSSTPVQNTLSIGGRWDFMSNAALKLQYDHTDIGAGSSGVLINLQPDYQSGGKVNVFSATIDFVL